MATETTIEEMIAAMEKRGWRMSHLSQIGHHGYSCILERKKMGDDGFPVYAASRAKPDATATEAVAAAWANAQKPIDNPRVFRPIGADRVEHTTLTRWFSEHLARRLQLEDALQALINCHTGEEDTSDDFL